MSDQQKSVVSSLNIESAKKQPNQIQPSQKDEFFFPRNPSYSSIANIQLSSLPRDVKLSQMETIYDSYNLLKYGNVLTDKRRSVSRFTDQLKLNRNSDHMEKNKSLHTFKNTKQTQKELHEMKSRLSKIQQNRKNLFNQIGKYVVSKHSQI